MSEQKTFYRTYKANTGYDGFNIGHKLNNTDDALYLGDKKIAFDTEKTLITSGGTNLSSVDVSELKGSDLEYYGENGSFLSGAIKTKGAISEETDSYIRAVGLMDNTVNDSGVEYIDKSDYTMHIFGTNKSGPAMRTTNIQGTIEQSVNVGSARIAVLSSTSAFTFNNKQVATVEDLASDKVLMSSAISVSGVTASTLGETLTDTITDLTKNIAERMPLFKGTFNADSCTATGIYEYITIGRSGLDTTTDDNYSLLVMNVNGIVRQIAYGRKKLTNIYTRLSSSGTLGTIKFEKIIKDWNTINLSDSNNITERINLQMSGLTDSDITYIITDSDGVYDLGSETNITVSTDMQKALMKINGGNEAIDAIMSNWQAYYQYLGTWYSQTISSVLDARKVKSGDKIRLIYKSMTLLEYCENLIDFDGISISDTAFQTYKTFKGYGSSTDGNFIKALINNGEIYSAYSEPNEGAETYQLKGTDIISAVTFEIVPEFKTVTASTNSNDDTVTYGAYTNVSLGRTNWFNTSADGSVLSMVTDGQKAQIALDASGRLYSRRGTGTWHSTNQIKTYTGGGTPDLNTIYEPSVIGWSICTNGPVDGHHLTVYTMTSSDTDGNGYRSCLQIAIDRDTSVPYFRTLFKNSSGILHTDWQGGYATTSQLETVESIAKGANQAIVFDSYSAMVSALNSQSAATYNTGQNIYIKTLEVPDLFVSATNTTVTVDISQNTHTGLSVGSSTIEASSEAELSDPIPVTAGVEYNITNARYSSIHVVDTNNLVVGQTINSLTIGTDFNTVSKGDDIVLVSSKDGYLVFGYGIGMLGGVVEYTGGDSFTTYTYTNDEAISEAVNTSDGLNIGFYVLNALETQKVNLDDYAELADIPEFYDSDRVKMTSGTTISGVTAYSSGDTLTDALGTLVNDIADIERTLSESVSEIYKNYITGITINDGDYLEKYNGAVNFEITEILSGGTSVGHELELNDIVSKFSTSSSNGNTTIYDSGNPVSAITLSALGSDPIYLNSISYADLYNLYDTGHLTPGAQYLIYDYVTTTSDLQTISKGEGFGLIVVADDENTINTKARACLNNTTRIIYTDLDGVKHVLSRDGSGDKTVSRSVMSEHLTLTMTCMCYIDSETDVAYYTLNDAYSGPLYSAPITGRTASVTTTEMHNADIANYAVRTLNLQFFRGTNSNYFRDSDLSKWEIWYDIENDTDRYNWADSTNGKGVIYRMIDEFGNDCSYDFKNIMFARTYDSGTTYYSITGGSTYCFTFSSDIPSTGTVSSTDMSLEGRSNHIYNNKIDAFYKEDTSIYELNDNCFFGSSIYNNTFGDSCYSNTFGDSCYSNTFGDSCNSNTFGDSCTGNTFCHSCYSNTLGNYCYSNTFGEDCHSNTFGDICYLNTFGDSCNSNTLGNYCYSNTLGYNCGSNIMHDKCKYNTIPKNSEANAFGFYCQNNTLGEANNYNSFEEFCSGNTFGANCVANKMGKVCTNNYFGNTCTSNILSNECQDNTFGGTSGTSSNSLGIGCRHNIIGSGTTVNYNNTLGHYCYYLSILGSKNTIGTRTNGGSTGETPTVISGNDNIIGNECTGILIGLNSQGNTIGNKCSNIEFGQYCNGNKFGDLVSHIKFGVQGNTEAALNYCSYIRVNSGNEYISITAKSRSLLRLENPVRNIIINEGVNNTTTWKTIEIDDADLNADHSIEYKSSNSEERII